MEASLLAARAAVARVRARAVSSAVESTSLDRFPSRDVRSSFGTDTLLLGSGKLKTYFCLIPLNFWFKEIPEQNYCT